MKRVRWFGFFVLALIFPAGLMAEECFALRYEAPGAGYYAAHMTYSFGTQLVVTNLNNQRQTIVQVGGRPQPGSWATIELPSDVADALDIKTDILTLVRIEEFQRVREEEAMRARDGKFKQTGPALVLPDSPGLSASHPSIPLGTRVKLTSLDTGKFITVTITGRIRASKERIIEISPGAARGIGIDETGEVQIESID
jgi:rare lipoprotein A